MLCSAHWGGLSHPVSMWIVAIGAQVAENWADFERPSFETRIFVMPPGGVTTQVWYLKGANGLAVTIQVTNVIMMAGLCFVLT